MLMTGGGRRATLANSALGAPGAVSAAVWNRLTRTSDIARPRTGVTVKKGRHRRYEEARALKRGGDLDIEGIFSDLSDEVVTSDDDLDDDDDRYSEYADYESEDEDPVRD